MSFISFVFSGDIYSMFFPFILIERSSLLTKAKPTMPQSKPETVVQMCFVKKSLKNMAKFQNL